MSAGIYNFTIEQGTTVVKQFTYKDSDGSPVDLSGYSASMQIRETYTSSDPVSTFTGSNASATGSEGLSIIASSGGATKGTIELNISATTTTAYTFDTAVYDLEITRISDSTVSRLLQGSIVLSPEVTKG
tara:strand:+ start:4364 stop:4753 length:390 start_codon:yes stop_codon:yes gene_type:complete